MTNMRRAALEPEIDFSCGIPLSRVQCIGIGIPFSPVREDMQHHAWTRVGDNPAMLCLRIQRFCSLRPRRDFFLDKLARRIQTMRSRRRTILFGVSPKGIPRQKPTWNNASSCSQLQRLLQMLVCCTLSNVSKLPCCIYGCLLGPDVLPKVVNQSIDSQALKLLLWRGLLLTCQVM